MADTMDLFFTVLSAGIGDDQFARAAEFWVLLALSIGVPAYYILR